MHLQTHFIQYYSVQSQITWKRTESIRQHAGWCKAVARILTDLWFVTVSAHRMLFADAV